MDDSSLKPEIPKSTTSAKLTLPDGKEVNIPIIHPTLGDPMLDVRALQSLTGMFTFDPGYTVTGSCASQICYIDGANGELYYRGYNVKDLYKNCKFVEVIYLLLFGELPSAKELEKFEEKLVDEMIVHSKMIDLYKNFKHNAHPMAIMVSVVGALATFETVIKSSYELKSDEQKVNCIKMIAKIPMLAGLAHRTSLGLPPVYPDSKLGFVENFLMMMFKEPGSEWSIHPTILSTIDKIFILHADHEQGPSSSTVRIAASSNANPFACISAGIASLWGPLHGAADEAIIEMLESIGNQDNIDAWIEKAKDKSTDFKLMGFGHRIYKSQDPRSLLMKEMVTECAQLIGHVDPLMKIAMELENRVKNDEYFTSRKIFPTIDFYTGIVYRLIGIPTNMFTVFFAVARTSGWMAQWKEMLADDILKISRPRQLFVGDIKKEIVDIEKRPREKKTKVNVPITGLNMVKSMNLRSRFDSGEEFPKLIRTISINN